MADPYSNSVAVSGFLGNATGALGNALLSIGDYALRLQIEAALKRAQPQIARIMPQGPTAPGSPTRAGVLVVAVTEQWRIANELGATGGSFKRLAVVGAFPSQKAAIDTYSRTPGLDGVTPGYVINPLFIWLTP